MKMWRVLLFKLRGAFVTISDRSGHLLNLPLHLYREQRKIAFRSFANTPLGEKIINHFFSLVQLFVGALHRKAFQIFIRGQRVFRELYLGPRSLLDLIDLDPLLAHHKASHLQGKVDIAHVARHRCKLLVGRASQLPIIGPRSVLHNTRSSGARGSRDSAKSQEQGEWPTTARQRQAVLSKCSCSTAVPSPRS